ncbi:MAG: hypothetical protein NTX65_08155 [Ignavibacteriales bacterium]|nr:hypothetical protein [Ignavibacteriales bacterium]
MKLNKIFKEELNFGLFTTFLFALVLWFDEPPLNKHWIGSLIYIATGWAVYYFVFIKSLKEYKLDEREMMIFTKTGNSASFSFVTMLVILFYLQEINFGFWGLPLKELWGRFLLPLFLIAHSVTGLILAGIEERQ